jgi:hypothetical protein
VRAAGHADQPQILLHWPELPRERLAKPAEAAATPVTANRRNLPSIR